MRVFDARLTEKMDDASRHSRSLRRTLRQLEFLNRHFWGHSYARDFLAQRWSSGSRCRMLDLATGGGDFPRALVGWARKEGVHLTVDAMDGSPAIVEAARAFSAGCDEIRYECADLLKWEPDCRYDLVHCSLSLHHFDTASAVEVLKRAKRWSQRSVLITDLERRWFTRWAVDFINAALRHTRMAKEDGDLSAQRAFSFSEFSSLAKGAEWTEFGHERFGVCRQALWLG